MTAAHLIALSEKAYGRLRPRLAGLTDDEYRWEPVPGTWSVRPRPDGSVGFDFSLMPLAPAPLSTIAWRLTHIIDLLREDRCATVLGLEPDAGTEEVWVTLSADEAITNLERAFATWRGYLERTDPDRLGEPHDRYTDRYTFALHIIDELIHHAAEVALLRDIYAARHSVDDDLQAVLDGDASRVEALRARRPGAVVELAAAGFWDDAAALARLGFDVNAPSTASALHHAAGMGRLELVRTLVEHGARIDAIDDVYHVTPRVWAETMGAVMGGPNAIGSDYPAVVELLRAEESSSGS